MSNLGQRPVEGEAAAPIAREEKDHRALVGDSQLAEAHEHSELQRRDRDKKQACAVAHSCEVSTRNAFVYPFILAITAFSMAACSGADGGPGGDGPTSADVGGRDAPSDSGAGETGETGEVDDVGAVDSPATGEGDASNPPTDASNTADTADTPDPVRPPPAGVGSCPVLSFPAGPAIYTFPDAALSTLYEKHLNGATPPQCFLDVDRLIDEKTGETHDWKTVELAPHFTLWELIHTEIDGGYSHRVLVSPALVTTLETFRTTLNASISITSGYRSPKHQEDICIAKCGNFYCPGTCGKASRHMFGDAVDLPFPHVTSYADVACSAQFRYVFWEFEHWHFDLDPSKAICTRAST